MSLETDLLLDRRRLKRRLVVLAHPGGAGADRRGAGGGARQGGTGGRSAHVARLTVSGIITENRKLDDAVAKLAEDDSVKALIVAIDSPGGSVAGGEALHDAIARVAAKKPVVAVMGGMAASAGYMIAVPAARIFAQPGTLTGSIGVLLQTGGRVRACCKSSASRADDHRLRPAEGPAQLHQAADAARGARCCRAW